MSGLTHNVSAQADELLDHIYEYGTNSEGVTHRINQLCDAAVEQLRSDLAVSREREARMRDALIVVRHHPAFDDGGPMAKMMDQVIGGQPSPLLEKFAEFAALAEGAQG